MLRLLGIPVSDDDARWLIAELYRDADGALAELRGLLMLQATGRE